jgi:diadenylate cyclase
MEFFENFLAIFRTIEFRDVVDILAIAFIIYGLFRLVRETRAVQLLKGVLVLFIIYFLSSLFGLVMLSSLLRSLFEASVVLVAIIFQPEIRKALEQMGRKNTWGRLISVFKHGKDEEWERKVTKSIIDAADTAILFSHSRTGALIVFERETMLSDIAASGTIVDAETSVALFGNMFFNKAPLHDGACIIRDGKLFAAGCILPLTDNQDVDINLFATPGIDWYNNTLLTEDAIDMIEDPEDGRGGERAHGAGLHGKRRGRPRGAGKRHKCHI